MNAFLLRVPAIPLVRVGIIGLGERGLLAVRRLGNIEGVCLSVVCDLNIDKIKIGSLSPSPRMMTDYHQVCSDAKLDLIYICTDWLSHTPIILEALQHGKHVAVEVPAATTLSDIRAIVDAAEQAQRHCMMLENCVYDYFEMAVRNMASQGVFGEVVHVEGGYAHPIGNKWPSWRLEYNHSMRGDVYPTHGMGPACQILQIHRNDRLESLISMDTAPFTGPDVYQEHTGKDGRAFQNGDQTTTVIRTMKGKTILLQHNVMTPRPYSRMFQVVGTKGYAEKIEDGRLKMYKMEDETLKMKDGVAPSFKKYLPSYVEQLAEKGTKLDSRGGMAYFMDWRLIHCLRHGLPFDMDVYDLAEWCAVSELSRRSIEQGFKAVEFPQFFDFPC